MGKQSQAFLDGESNAWLARNKSKLPVENDPVIKTLLSTNIVPSHVLEIGCANGWRLKLLREKYGCKATGIDPCIPKSHLWLADIVHAYRGTADDLDSEFHPYEYDLIIYGFCLYLCDREDLFKIVSEGDRVLQDSGYLVVYDFHPHTPHKRPYKHREGLFSYKMDYANLWLANSAYTLYRRAIFGTGDDATSVTILRKQVDKGWPLHE